MSSHTRRASSMPSYLVLPVIAFATVLSSWAAAAQPVHTLNPSHATPEPSPRVEIQSPTVAVNGQVVRRYTTVSIETNGAVMFYDPNYGVFVVSPDPFQGGERSGTFDGSTIRFTAGGHHVEVRSTEPVLKVPEAQTAYVLHIDRSGGRDFIGAVGNEPVTTASMDALQERLDARDLAVQVWGERMRRQSQLIEALRSREAIRRHQRP